MKFSCHPIVRRLLMGQLTILTAFLFATSTAIAQKASDALIPEMKSLQKESKSLTKTIAKNEKKLAKVEKKMASEQTELEEMQASLNVLKGEALEGDAYAARKVLSMEGKVARQQNYVAELSSRKNNHEKIIQDSHQRISDIGDELQILEARMTYVDAQAEADVLANLNSEHQQQITELEAKLSEAKAEVELATIRLANLRKTLDAQLAAAPMATKPMKGEMEKETEDGEASAAPVMVTNEDIASAETSLRDAELVAVDLYQQIDEHNYQIRKSTRDLEELIHKAESSRQMFEQVEAAYTAEKEPAGEAMEEAPEVAEGTTEEGTMAVGEMAEETVAMTEEGTLAEATEAAEEKMAEEPVVVEEPEEVSPWSPYVEGRDNPEDLPMISSMSSDDVAEDVNVGVSDHHTFMTPGTMQQVEPAPCLMATASFAGPGRGGGPPRL